ncbi:metal dependent phosphohydrolase [Novosphingobium nitrogenifigens DSM 19370]|uniref:Metal dependent phosphohydrolase n=1 Tax=Novosphingobium nitrogenifigens DSM 19370 TaxID=983920 RepID=F1ZBH8_9SPHN|nr:DUF3391 domain-containing protein [Novosphingobium nitrogenifigens]EGD58035.1 metal dependent phosphohydrolase [Novosphingobium nitrogenifigens DSM 19370]
MLKRIDPSDVTLGMFIHKLEGSWFRHPFWRARFLLNDPDRLEQIRTSGLSGIVIDTERGADAPIFAADAVPEPETPAAPSAPSPTPLSRVPAPVALHTRTRLMSTLPAATSRGFGRAESAAEKGMKIVSRVFLEMRLGKTIAPDQIIPVIDAIIDSMQSNPFAFNGLMRFRRDNEFAYRHALAVSALMIALGRTLRLSKLDLHEAGLAGLLLDAGVCLLPLDDAQREIEPHRLPTEIWQQHVPLGHAFVVRSKLSENVARACLEHHERMDGTGWPQARPGSSLSQLGRMAAICDAYDLLATGTSERPGLDPAEALQQMKSDHGAYDRALLAAFEATIGIWPTGSLLELRSGRLAVVIDQSSDRPDRPIVAIFFDMNTGQAVGKQFIDLANCYGADGIAGPGLLARLPDAQQAIASASLAATIARLAPKSGARAQPSHRTALTG